MKNKRINQMAKRITAILSAPTIWSIFAAVTLICFLSGPFRTLEAIPSGIRLVYWGLIVITTGLIGVVAHAYLSTHNVRSHSQILVMGLVQGLGVSILVILISLALLGPIQVYPGTSDLFIYSFPVALVVFVISIYLENWRKDGINFEEGPVNVPTLLARLEKYPNAKQIFAIKAQDHYVAVTTELGTELCLMRLGDAIAEASPTVGMQIHRSNWVAKSAIKSLVTRGSNPRVELVDGTSMSISRSHLKEIKVFLNG